MAIVPAMERTLLILAGLVGLTAVAAGAFGAHGLDRSLAATADGAERLGWWRTGAQYHLAHAAALGIAAWAAGRTTGAAPAVAGWCFLAGVVLFSGSLYAMTLGAPRWLGAVTPFGGLSLIAGWAALVWAGVRWSSS